MNPLNSFLYGRMADGFADVAEFDWHPLALRSADILHVHWPDLVPASRFRLWSILRSAWFLLCVRLLRARGGKLVWTAHNAVPHDQAQPFLWSLYWPRFLQAVDGVIFLTEASRRQTVAAMPALSALPWAIIRRGNFRPLLGTPPDRAAARARLGLPHASRILLNFGQIRPYKNVPLLVREFLALGREDAILIVAGQVRRGSGLDRELEALADGRPQVRLDLRFIPDETLALYLAAADLVVLPYRDILNSGGLLLALSAARPTLCPRRGSIAEIADEVGPGWVHTYDGEFTGALLAAALDAPPPASAEPDLSGFDWDVIARQHLEFYRRLLDGPHPEPARG